mmetsp:Transcript_90185/g.282086  ORF Transcript_90185/g.282086 Transcript_90185/m.282086 type:complete len:100 (+) Transcript_90185:3-302(+)
MSSRRRPRKVHLASRKLMGRPATCIIVLLASLGGGSAESPAELMGMPACPSHACGFRCTDDTCAKAHGFGWKAQQDSSGGWHCVGGGLCYDFGCCIWEA